MVKTNAEIISEINAQMKRSGIPNAHWYVGITASIEDRLHGDHGVPKENHWFIWRAAQSADDARAIEKAYLDAGCKGGPGGGDEDSIFIYAYVITESTIESA